MADGWPSSPRAPEALRRRAAGVLVLGGPLAAAAALDVLLERYPAEDEAADDAFRAAFLVWRAGRVEEARGRLEALAVGGGEGLAGGRAHYWLGRLAADAGRAEAATEAWRRAVTSDPLGYYGLRAGQRLGEDWPAPPEAAEPVAAGASHLLFDGPAPEATAVLDRLRDAARAERGVHCRKHGNIRDILCGLDRRPWNRKVAGGHGVRCLMYRKAAVQVPVDREVEPGLPCEEFSVRQHGDALSLLQVAANGCWTALSWHLWRDLQQERFGRL